MKKMKTRLVNRFSNLTIHKLMSKKRIEMTGLKLRTTKTMREKNSKTQGSIYKTWMLLFLAKITKMMLLQLLDSSKTFYVNNSAVSLK